VVSGSLTVVMMHLVRWVEIVVLRGPVLVDRAVVSW
jgi:hypothetical protein